MPNNDDDDDGLLVNLLTSGTNFLVPKTGCDWKVQS